MKQLNTKYAVENVMCCAIAKWFETGHVPLHKYPEEFHNVIWSKGAIGWRHVLNGRVSNLWLEHQGTTKTSSGKVRMDYSGGVLIVETCLRMMVDLWEMRNEEVNGKEEATLQQKRKAKAANTVQVLHKPEEQARPSDSILFYQDVEETNELVSAATLEGFIAMKTRSINNSVRE